MKTWFFSGLFLFSSFAYSAPLTLNDILKRLSDREKSTHATRFVFEQQLTYADNPIQTLVKGKALFAKGGKLRVEKTSPNNQVILSNGRDLWIHNPAARQVWKGTARSWVGSAVFPKGLLPVGRYVSDLKKNFHLQMETGGNQSLVDILATPKDANLGYTLRLTLLAENGTPVKTVYTSESATIVTLISDLEINPLLSATTFQFNVPLDTDVIPLS